MVEVWSRDEGQRGAGMEDDIASHGGQRAEQDAVEQARRREKRSWAEQGGARQRKEVNGCS